MAADTTERLDRIRDAFARQATTFDAHAAKTDLAVEDRFVQALGAAAAGRILDVACGTGVVTAAIARRATEAVGLDATDAMLAKARARAAGLANVAFQAGDAENLPFADGEFDGVVTRLSMHHFEQPSRALAEMRRVLRPGGRVVVVDVTSSDDPAKSELHNAIEILRDPSHVRMLPADELDSLIVDAGFTNLSVSTWRNEREFDEWMGIVNDPKLVAPLRAVVQALAADGRDAGIGLRLDGEVVRFFHDWRLVAADKPAEGEV